MQPGLRAGAGPGRAGSGTSKVEALAAVHDLVLDEPVDVTLSGLDDTER